jgi:hypothetical protein
MDPTDADIDAVMAEADRLFYSNARANDYWLAFTDPNQTPPWWNAAVESIWVVVRSTPADGLSPAECRQTLEPEFDQISDHAFDRWLKDHERRLAVKQGNETFLTHQWIPERRREFAGYAVFHLLNRLIELALFPPPPARIRNTGA